MKKSNSKNTLRHMGIVVNSLKKSLEFYRDVLGLNVIYDQTEQGDFFEHLVGFAGLSAHIVKLQDMNGMVIELLEHNIKGRKNSVNQANDLGLNHIAITVQNVDPIYNKMSKIGNIISEPRVNPSKTVKAFFCYTPDHIILEVVEVL